MIQIIDMNSPVTTLFILFFLFSTYSHICKENKIQDFIIFKKMCKLYGIFEEFLKTIHPNVFSDTTDIQSVPNSSLSKKNKNANLGFLKNIYTFFDLFYNAINPDIFTDLYASESESDLDCGIKKDDSDNCGSKLIPKYEDKYLEHIKHMEKEYIFTEEEKMFEEETFKLRRDTFISGYENEIQTINDKIKSLVQDINDIECIECSQETENDNDNDNDNDNKEKIKFINNEILESETEIICIKEKLNNKEQIENDSREYAKKSVIKKRIDKLKGCYVMEKTPIGNVLMIYSNDRNTFIYYSDIAIPYRYLEVVGRKYVKMFHCRPIFVDMEEELNLYEKKLEVQREKDEKDRLKKEEEKNNNQNTKSIENKKSVFVKLKTYNKSSGHVNMAAPPKNSIPNRQIGPKDSNVKTLLKENANRYTYEGKLSNFIFLQKIERKVVDKKYGMNFSDFKKMNYVK